MNWNLNAAEFVPFGSTNTVNNASLENGNNNNDNQQNNSQYPCANDGHFVTMFEDGMVFFEHGDQEQELPHMPEFYCDICQFQLPDKATLIEHTNGQQHQIQLAKKRGNINHGNGNAPPQAQAQFQASQTQLQTQAANIQTQNEEKSQQMAQQVQYPQQYQMYQNLNSPHVAQNRYRFDNQINPQMQQIQANHNVPTRAINRIPQFQPMAPMQQMHQMHMAPTQMPQMAQMPQMPQMPQMQARPQIAPMRAPMGTPNNMIPRPMGMGRGISNTNGNGNGNGINNNRNNNPNINRNGHLMNGQNRQNGEKSRKINVSNINNNMNNSNNSNSIKLIRADAVLIKRKEKALQGQSVSFNSLTHDELIKRQDLNLLFSLFPSIYANDKKKLIWIFSKKCKKDLKRSILHVLENKEFEKKFDKNICVYHLSLQCTHEKNPNKCRYFHDRNVPSAICRFWLKKQCNQGKTCPFLHKIPKPNVMINDTSLGGKYQTTTTITDKNNKNKNKSKNKNSNNNNNNDRNDKKPKLNIINQTDCQIQAQKRQNKTKIAQTQKLNQKKKSKTKNNHSSNNNNNNNSNKNKSKKDETQSKSSSPEIVENLDEMVSLLSAMFPNSKKNEIIDLLTSHAMKIKPVVATLLQNQELNDLDSSSSNIHANFVTSNPSEQVCRFYLLGVCTRGTTCPFAHSRDIPSAVCKYWAFGYCSRGDECIYMHKLPSIKHIAQYMHSQYEKSQSLSPSPPNEEKIDVNGNELISDKMNFFNQMTANNDNNNNGNNNVPSDIVAKLRLSVLSEEFCHVSIIETRFDDLKEIFISNNYHLDKTRKELNHKYGPCPNNDRQKCLKQFLQKQQRTNEKNNPNRFLTKTTTTTTTSQQDSNNNSVNNNSRNNRNNSNFVDTSNIRWVDTGEGLNELYKQTRESAEYYARLRNECFMKAVDCYVNGNSQNASKYSKQGKFYDKEMKRLHNEACNAIFWQRNYIFLNVDKNLSIIDLHGLHINEAIVKLTQRIQRLKMINNNNNSKNKNKNKNKNKKHKNKQNRFFGYLDVLTGTGHHSFRGTPRLLPHIIKYCQKNRFKCQEMKGKDNRGGMMRISIDKTKK